jgi:hypothetical protein
VLADVRERETVLADFSARGEAAGVNSYRVQRLG